MANGNQQPTFAGQKVSPAMARAVSAFSASLEAEAQRRSRLGLSGAGLAAGFKEAMSPITDYSDMLEGNAAPGTVLFDAAMKSAEDKNKKLEDKGVDSENKAYEVDEVDIADEQEGEFPDLLARPVETEEADIVPNTIRQAVQEGIERGAEITGPPRPVLLDNPGYSFNMMEALKRYSPQVLEQSEPVIEQKAMPEVRQATGQGDTEYLSAPGLAGRPSIPGQFAGGRAVPAE